MENNNLEDLLVLYALGELEPDEVLTVEEELQKRPELVAQVEKYRRTDRLLADVFALSDEAVLQEYAKESAKAKVAGKTETSQSRLAYRFAFTAAALALVVVAGALLYPLFVSKDVQVAMSPEDETIKSSNTEIPPRIETTKEQIDPHFTLNSTGADEGTDEANAPEAAYAVDSDRVEDDMAAPSKEALDGAQVPPPAVPEPEEAHEQYVMDNGLYDIPGQKTADGMAPIKGEIPPMPAMRMETVETHRKANEVIQTFKLNQPDRGVAADAGPALGSYSMLRKCVMEENRLPSPESVNVEQWRDILVSIPDKIMSGGQVMSMRVSENEVPHNNSRIHEEKEDLFVKAMNRFADLLSRPEPADVRAFEEVLDMVKYSIDGDPKRQEFAAIVEKTIAIVKKRSE